MTSPPPLTKTIAVSELGAFYRSLSNILVKTGLTGNQLNEVFANSVNIKCVDCGIPLTGEDLGSIVLAGQDGRLENAKLARLRLGYCARKDCSSRYYTATFNPHPNLDWTNLLSQMDKGSNESPSSAADTSAPPGLLQAKAAARQRFVRVAIGIALVLVLLFCKYLMSGGSIPGFRSTPKYQVDPQSLPTDVAK